MRTVVWVVLALLIGLLLGEWSLREDLRKARRELDLARAQLHKGAGKAAGMAGITSMLQIPERRSREPSHAVVAPVRSAAEPVPAEGDLQDASQAVEIATNAVVGMAEGQTNMSLKERIRSATELWRTRKDLARTSFMDNVKPEAAQAVQFDVVMSAMNLRLSNSIQKWAEALTTEEQFSPEMGIRMMNELSGVVVLTYDELDRTLAPEWRQRAGEDFQLLDFINPEVALPLVGVEDVIRKGEERRYGGPFGSPNNHPPPVAPP